MIQLIVNAFVEKDKTGAVVEVLYASSNHEKVRAKYEELVAQYPENYLAIYDLPMDTDLNKLDHYPSVWIGKEELEDQDRISIINSIVFFVQELTRLTVADKASKKCSY